MPRSIDLADLRRHAVARSLFTPTTLVKAVQQLSGQVSDAKLKQMLAPGQSRRETAPGGVAPSRAALFNVAFRYDEPMPAVANPAAGWTIADAAAGAGGNAIPDRLLGGVEVWRVNS